MAHDWLEMTTAGSRGPATQSHLSGRYTKDMSSAKRGKRLRIPQLPIAEIGGEPDRLEVSRDDQFCGLAAWLITDLGP